MTIDDIFNANWPGFMSYSELKADKRENEKKELSASQFMIALKQAYALGAEKLEKSKEIDYHISPRQTKIDFNGMG